MNEDLRLPQFQKRNEVVPVLHWSQQDGPAGVFCIWYFRVGRVKPSFGSSSQHYSLFWDLILSDSPITIRFKLDIRFGLWYVGALGFFNKVGHIQQTLRWIYCAPIWWVSNSAKMSPQLAAKTLCFTAIGHPILLGEFGPNIRVTKTVVPPDNSALNRIGFLSWNETVISTRLLVFAPLRGSYHRTFCELNEWSLPFSWTR